MPKKPTQYLSFCRFRQMANVGGKGLLSHLSEWLMFFQCALLCLQKDEVYLNLVLEYVPETVYRVARHYSKNKQTIPILYIKVSDIVLACERSSECDSYDNLIFNCWLWKNIVVHVLFTRKIQLFKWGYGNTAKCFVVFMHQCFCVACSYSAFLVAIEMFSLIINYLLTFK